MPKQKKLLVDDSWNGDSGTGRYAREIIEHINGLYCGEVSSLTRRNPSSPIGPIKLALQLSRECRGIFWSPQYMLPAFAKIPCVPTIHDLLQIRFGSREKRIYFNHVLRPLIRRAPKIITVSEFSRGEIADWAKVPAERVKVIPNGLSNTFTGAEYEPPISNPYFLYVGNKRPHKNIYRMLQAFSLAKIPNNVIFFLSGRPSFELLNFIREQKIHGRIAFSGYIKESDLPAWYSNALALIDVSLYEGFGLPVLEAMGSKCPVIASNSTALAETSGNAALLVNPLDVEEISDAMERIISDDHLRSTLIERGNHRKEQFSWVKSSRKLIDELLEL